MLLSSKMICPLRTKWLNYLGGNSTKNYALYLESMVVRGRFCQNKYSIYQNNYRFFAKAFPGNLSYDDIRFQESKVKTLRIPINRSSTDSTGFCRKKRRPQKTNIAIVNRSVISWFSKSYKDLQKKVMGKKYQHSELASCNRRVKDVKTD